MVLLEAAVEAVETAVDEAAADPTMAGKTKIKIGIINLIKIKIIQAKVTTLNLTSEVLAMLTGPQIPVAPGTGPKAEERPTVRIL